MATNKNAFLRYRVLDKCFANRGRSYTIGDLIVACTQALQEINPDCKGVSRRQIYCDIAFMEGCDGWGIELLRERSCDNRITLRYADSSFSILNSPLKPVEITYLRSTIELLNRFEGMPLWGELSEILYKLDVVSEPANSAPVIGFDTNPYLKGIEHLGVLYSSIAGRQVLCITYRAYGWTEAQQFEIHPYFLKQYNRRWFLYGYNPQAQKQDWNLALDRIEQIGSLPRKTYLESTIDWREYFSDIVGVTKRDDQVLERVTLHCYGTSGNYIVSKPIHESQRHRWIDSDLLEVTIDVLPNQELIQWILGQGSSLKVITPASLCQAIKKQISASFSMYHTPPE